MTAVAPEVLPPQFSDGSQSTLIQTTDTTDLESQTTVAPPLPWWHQRTKLERRLLILAWLCTLICGALLLALALTMKSAPSPPSVCITRECLRTANDLLANLDEGVDPCDNFYEFSCGGFLKSVQIPEDQGEVSRFRSVGDQLEAQVRVILEKKEPQTASEGPESFQLLKNLYKSCMDTQKLEEIGLEPLKKVFDKFGGWPVLLASDNSSESSWNSTKFNWMDTVSRFHQDGFSDSYLLSVFVRTDKKNSTLRRLHLGHPTFGLTQSYLLFPPDHRVVRAYAKYQIELAMLFGSNRTQAETDMAAVLKFERRLAQSAILRTVRNESEPYNLMTIADIQATLPAIPWLEYVNGIISPGKNEIEANELVLVSNLNFLARFQRLIHNSDKRALANYLMWRLAKDAVPFLNEAARDLRFEYNKVVTGITKPKPRWWHCVRVVESELPVAIGSHYVRHYYDPETTPMVNEMVSNIRSAFFKILDDIDWMDEGTKRKAKEKLTAMSSHVGHPPELLDGILIDHYYTGVKMTADEYHKNILGLNQLLKSNLFKILRKRVPKSSWSRHGAVAVVNAYYLPQENSITIPAGILQDLFFQRDRPNYMNYGAIGAIIGHEITHGFDDQGSQYDADGNLSDWWEPKSKKKYLEKAQCIIDQYDNYSVPQLGNMRLSGVKTQGENIADNGGIKEAYRAYIDWSNRRGEEEPKLPGLDYNVRQLFWISAANVWCGKYRLDTLQKRILTDVHSPAQFRVIGPMSNSEEFARDFNCSMGSGMNPVKKCSVW